MRVLLAIFFILLIVLAYLVLAGRKASHRRMARGGGCDGGDAFGDEGDDWYEEREEGYEGGGVFRLKVADPWYEAMYEGKKTVEGRLDRGPFSRLKQGDPVVVVRSRPQGDQSEYTKGPYKYTTEVVRVTKYANYAALIKAEGADKIFPGKKTAEAATDEFKKHLRDPADLNGPAIAIELKPPTKGKK